MCAYSQLIILTVFTIICNHGGGVPHCKNNFSLFSLEQILTPVYDKKIDGLLVKSDCSLYSPYCTPFLWAPLTVKTISQSYH